jgi:hypothetical protein
LAIWAATIKADEVAIGAERDGVVEVVGEAEEPLVGRWRIG